MQDIDKAILSNKGLVYKQLHKFGLIDDQEAESLAFWALYNALVNYDESKGIKLSTVATVYIYNALGSYVRKLNAKRIIQEVSYNTIVQYDGTEYEMLNILPDSKTVESEIIREERCKLTELAFNEMYNKLTNDMHKAILKEWKRTDYEGTTTSISDIVGVSQSYVSQVINNFKAKLRKRLEDVYYD